VPLAEVGELDPLAARTRDLVAGEHLRLERRNERPQRLLARVDAQQPRLAALAVPGAEAEQVARPEEHRADTRRTPAVAAKRQLERSRLSRPERQRERGAVLGAELLGQGQEHLEPVGSGER
jgi:hypothetical protein